MKTPTPEAAPRRPDAASHPMPSCDDGFECRTALAGATHAEIQTRAHSIWEGKGRPDRSELCDWLQAEAEVAGES